MATAAAQAAQITILSRLIDDSAFGLMTMANLAATFGQYVTDAGVSHALVQRPRLEERHIRAGATSGLVLGLAAAVVIYVLAPAVSDAYNEPRVTPLLRALGVNFIFIGLSLTSRGLLRRQMQFRALALSGAISALCGAVVAVVLAFAGFEVWALVWGSIVTSAVNAAQLYNWTRHPLRLLFEWRPVASLYSYGLKITFLRVLEFANKNLDTFSVGRYMTAAATGQYGKAYSLVNLPLSRHVQSGLTRVLFPGFARVQNDSDRLRGAFVSVVTLGSAVVFPLVTGMGVAADQLVEVALGGQWDRAAALLPYFCFALGLGMITKFAELVNEATGRLQAQIVLQILMLLVLVMTLTLATLIGDLWAFAAALCVVESVRHLAFLLLLRARVRLELRDVATAYVGPLVLSGLVGAAVWAAERLGAIAGLPLILVFLLEVMLAGVALSAGLRFLPLHSLRVELRKRLHGADEPPTKGLLGRAVRWILPKDAVAQGGVTR